MYNVCIYLSLSIYIYILYIYIYIVIYIHRQTNRINKAPASSGRFSGRPTRVLAPEGWIDFSLPLCLSPSLSLSLYIYIYIYMHVYIYIYIYIYVYMGLSRMECADGRGIRTVDFRNFILFFWAETLAH